MSANSFGQHFRITSFGESHGPALGVVIEGCPSGVKYDEALLTRWLERRRPGQSVSVSARSEMDRPEILSGIFEGRTLGTPICVVVRNQDARSQDYDTIAQAPRAGHADDVWKEKFSHVDHRGGGRSSGRETLARVMGGAFAEMFLREVAPPVQVTGWPQKVGSITLTTEDVCPGNSWNISASRKEEIEKFLVGLKAEGDSVGGVIEIWVTAPPKNLGQPVFRKLKSDLAAAYMSVGATTGVELGGGFSLSEKRGVEVHGPNRDAAAYGGIRGGISTGEKMIFRVAFKPTSSILDEAKKGRHDPCIVMRAIPVLEAMTYLVLADHVLWSRLDQVRGVFS